VEEMEGAGPSRDSWLEVRLRKLNCLLAVLIQ